MFKTGKGSGWAIRAMWIRTQEQTKARAEHEQDRNTGKRETGQKTNRHGNRYREKTLESSLRCTKQGTKDNLAQGNRQLICTRLMRRRENRRAGVTLGNDKQAQLMKLETRLIMTEGNRLGELKAQN